MVVSYQNELYELRKWIDNNNNNITMQMQVYRSPQEIDKVRSYILTIADGIRSEYKYYADILPKISSILFFENNFGVKVLNPTAFGELAIITRHIEIEPLTIRFWDEIHSRICNVSYELFLDGHYVSAAENAVKEVETRLRDVFIELKPGFGVPTRVEEIINALLVENGLFKFCDITTPSGKNYRRGIEFLFRGTMAAYRNPLTHANIIYNKREAMEQITLASQLMFVLDCPQN